MIFREKPSEKMLNRQENKMIFFINRTYSYIVVEVECYER